jgi:hypothetical protein
MLKKIKLTKHKNFNFFLLGVIGCIFLFLLYLSIPVLYNYKILQIQLEDKINKEFEINIKVSKEIKYRMFPKPHLIIANSELHLNKKDESNKISNLKKIIVNLSFLNLINQKNLEIKKIEFIDSIFEIKHQDWINVKKLLKKKLSNKKILIKNSKIFYKNEEKTIAIILINKLKLQFIDKKSINEVVGYGNVYNSDFEIAWKRDFNNPYSTNLNFNFIELGFKFNDSFQRDDKITSQYNGKNIISFPRSNFKTSYKFQKDSITFLSDTLQVGQIKGDYNGKINYKPFNFDFSFNLKQVNLDQLLDKNFLYFFLNKLSIFYNENFNGLIKININPLKTNNKLFNSIEMIVRFQNDNIQILQLNLISNIYGVMNINGTVEQQGNLKYNIKFNVKNLRKLYSKFQIQKKYRYDFKNFSLKGSFNNNLRKILFKEFYIDDIKRDDDLKFINEFLKDYSKNNELSSINFLEFKKIITYLITEAK